MHPCLRKIKDKPTPKWSKPTLFTQRGGGTRPERPERSPFSTLRGVARVDLSETPPPQEVHHRIAVSAQAA